MENNDFISSVTSMSNRFYKVMYKNFPFYMKLYGTLCSVERLVRTKPSTPNALPSRDQMINQTYGKIATRDDYDRDSEVLKFNETFIINKESVTRYYNNQADEIQIYFNQNILDLGDKLSFNRYGKSYSFIVGEVSQYSDILFEYRLTGIKDYVVK